jgi:hypothetical protein
VSHTRTCFDCLRADIEAGFVGSREEPSSPAIAICDLPDEVVSEDDSVKFSDDATECLLFDPILVKKCGICNCPIGVPVYLWELFAVDYYGEESYAVCSDACGEVAAQRFEIDRVSSESMGDLGGDY